MSVYTIAFIKAIILPPTINFIFILAGLFLKKRKKILSKFFIYTGSLTFVLFCLLPFSDFLLKNLEQYPPLKFPVRVEGEQAIVILSGGSQLNAPEFGKGIDGSLTLQRNRYAALLEQQTGLPVLVSGGKVMSDLVSEASVMTSTLTDSFGIEVRWQEEESLNTAENAFYSANILKKEGIDTIFLVTHAWHMPRAVMMFEKQGLKVTPAPTIFVFNEELHLLDYLPSAGALCNTRLALHEYLGMIWYKIRY